MKATVFAYCCLSMVLASMTASRADPIEDFYKSRPLTFLIGFAPGGGNDSYARSFAHFLPKHLAGSPVVVMRYMQGASSVTAANHLFSQSPRDGSEIGMLLGPAALEPLIGSMPTQYDGRRFSWLGSLNREVGACYAWHTSQIYEAKDLWDKQMVTGTGGGTMVTFPLALNVLLGTRMKLVKGYAGAGAVMVAIEAGEVEGMCGMIYSAINTDHHDWLAENKMRTVMQIGLEKSPLLPDVPLVMDYVKTDDDRQIMQLLFGWMSMGRPIVAPPGIPADRFKALRTAFMDTARDPDFLAEAKKLHVDIDPVDGAYIDAFLEKAYNTPSPLVKKAAQILKAGG